MNGEEKTILKNVVDNLSAVSTDVKWVIKGLDELKDTFEQQIITCNKHFDKQDERIENNKTRIWRVVVLVALIAAAMGGGISEVLHLVGI
jgi:chaperonin cofactor prefoldin